MSTSAPVASRMLPSHVILGRALMAHPNRNFAMYSGTEAERTIRYCRAGDLLDIDDEFVAEAMATGIYLRASVIRENRFAGNRWLYLGSIDDLEGLIEMDRPDVGDLEVHGLAVAAAFWSSQLR